MSQVGKCEPSNNIATCRLKATYPVDLLRQPCQACQLRPVQPLEPEMPGSGSFAAFLERVSFKVRSLQANDKADKSLKQDVILNHLL